MGFVYLNFLGGKENLLQQTYVTIIALIFTFNFMEVKQTKTLHIIIILLDMKIISDAYLIIFLSSMLFFLINLSFHHKFSKSNLRRID